jgi:uncharacterized damage-inducible protein DinB
VKRSRSGTREALRQFLNGDDFEPPERMIADLTPERATEVPSGFPYSIADQVGHMLFWQRRWLGQINGEPLERKKGKHGDWLRVSADQWEKVRAEFLAGLEIAAAKAKDESELPRRLRNGDTVDSVLLQLALHNTDHLGQIALIRQMLNIWPPTGGWDSW